MAIDESLNRSEVACPGRRMRWCLPAACSYRQVMALFYAFRGPLTVFALVSLALAIWSGVRFGSLRAAVSYWEGFSIIAEPQKVLLQDVPVGEPVVATFRLRNLSGNAVKVVGAVSDCGCAAAENLPLVMEPHGALDFRVRFAIPSHETAPRVSYLTQLHLDVPSPPVFLHLEATLGNREDAEEMRNE
jgi:hypothetical protein